MIRISIESERKLISQGNFRTNFDSQLCYAEQTSSFRGLSDCKISQQCTILAGTLALPIYYNSYIIWWAKHKLDSEWVILVLPGYHGLSLMYVNGHYYHHNLFTVKKSCSLQMGNTSCLILNCPRGATGKKYLRHETTGWTSDILGTE